jgi:hypothetical protein
MHVVADSKYGSARLKKLVDGTKQMSDDWIEERLVTMLGRRRALQLLREGYQSVVAKISPSGDISYKLLDADAKTIGEFTP